MSDFFQNGVITNLSRIVPRSLPEMESELRELARTFRAALVLPALYREFEGPAMPRILDQLCGADYLQAVVLSLDGADEGQFRRVREQMSVLPVPVHILWNDGPRIRALLDELAEGGFRVDTPGKGRGIWLASGFALTDPEVDALALHDCDIVSYDRELLVRLLYPLAHPALDFEFSKGYYPRVSGQLYGRVTRLFVTPLLAALIRVLGPLPYLEYLNSFRYALSGEVALVRRLAAGLRISSDWGLEISMLGEIFRQTNHRRVCQVEVADRYEHKHQPLGADFPGSGLSAMAMQIANALYLALSQEGVVFSPGVFASVAATYVETTRQAIEQYHALALINGLSYDRTEEIRIVRCFQEALERCQQQYWAQPTGAPLLSAWVRVRAAIPDFPARLVEAVTLDADRCSR